MKKISSIENIFKKGSSLPVSITDTSGEKYFVKLKGTGEGTIALISDYISSKLGTELGLPVLDPFLIELDKDVKVNLKNDELYDLINSSYGINLGFDLLENSREYSDQYYGELLNSKIKDLIFLFDCFLLNIDRTSINHDVVVSANKVYALDFGASFLFRGIIHNIRYQDSPEIAGQLKRHIFYREGIAPQLLVECFTLLSFDKIKDIVNDLPDEWLIDLKRKEDLKVELTESIYSKIQNKEYLPKLLKLISETEVESEEKRIERQRKNREDFENRFLKRK